MVSGLFLLCAQVQAPSIDRAIERIQPSALRSHVAFLASDALQGRNTPSKELDIAAEYIATRFAAAGLKPLADGTYFQVLDPTLGRNVIGVLPGSDPKLKDTYVIVSAHYDHIGAREGEGDQIFNGANDNASGTSAMIESAFALSNLKTAPKRTVLFIAWSGEEKGLKGSRAYAAAPVYPLSKTIANLNLEQVGRVDDSEAKRVNAVAVTGIDFSSVGDELIKIGKVAGIEVQKHPRFSDAFFNASDNAALANEGVPAHTICTAFQFEDYHRQGDHWDKLDYENMAKVTRFVARAAFELANQTTAPTWKADNPKAKRYLEKRNQGGR